VGDVDAITLPDRPGRDDAQVGAGTRGAREAPDPAMLGEPTRERAAGDPRARHLEEERVADSPAFTDEGLRHVELRRGQVLSEASVVKRSTERGGPGVEILARVDVDGLIITAVVAPVADRVADEAAAQTVSLGAGRADLDRARHRPLVDAGDADTRAFGDLGPADVDREHHAHPHSIVLRFARGEPPRDPWQRLG